MGDLSIPDPLVVARSVSRRFGSGDSAMDALKEATCVVYPSDLIALVGPSGSGKSTLLHLLDGLDQPTTGIVDWPALGNRESLRPLLVADIFQGQSLLPPLSVLENVRLPLLLGGTGDTEATRRAEYALDLFQVGALRDKLPEEISGGQAQRVAIARAVVVRPRLLVADEPTGQLDTATAAAVLTVLLGLAVEMEAALLLSTHDSTVVERFPIVWSLRDGYLMTDGPDVPTARLPDRAVV